MERIIEHLQEMGKVSLVGYEESVKDLILKLSLQGYEVFYDSSNDYLKLV